MEPIQTPTNEALDLQIQALKGRVTMLELEVDHVRDMARIDYQRSIKWDLDQSRSIRRLWFMFFLVAVSIILHNISHMIGLL